MTTNGVFIGRMQPFHNGHLSAIHFALDHIDGRLLVMLGSAYAARNIKNPWSAGERKEFIRAALTPEQNARVIVQSISDALYNDNQWVAEMQNRVATALGGDDTDSVKLFGHRRDRSSYYLDLFPQWIFEAVPEVAGINATALREMYFDCALRDLQQHVPLPVWELLKNHMMATAVTTREEFKQLKAEYEFIQDYKDRWKDAPFAPTFLTVDAVVIQSGHVLVVRRKGYPGKGLVALPGGFVGQAEAIQDACIRELREETRIQIAQPQLHKYIVANRVFDHPDRSLRGRTVTHAFCLSLPAGPLTRVQGDDDADKAWWMPLREVARNEEKFYEDHFHIIQHFVSRF